MSEKLDIARSIDTDNWGHDEDCIAINMQSRPSAEDARPMPPVEDARPMQPVEDARPMPIACECNCGFSCRRQCGLPIKECIDLHYKQDCSHQWDGPVVDTGMGHSVTCSKCGLSSLFHDLKVGP